MQNYLRVKKSMLVRIPLTDDNSVITPVYTETDSTEQPETPTIPVSFALTPASLDVIPDYNHSRYAFPATGISVTVPEDDKPLVDSWLGTGMPSAAKPSDTLVKRMTAAVTDAINKYFIDCGRRSLFTRPFRAVFALRHTDGTFSHVSNPILMQPSTGAPLMIIRETQTSGNILSTITEIVNIPSIFSVNIRPFELPPDVDRDVTHLVISATNQTDTLSGEESVSGIRSFSLYGEHLPGWAYNRLPEDIVTSRAMTDTKFRILAEIPIGEALNGLVAYRIPRNNADLNNSAAFPTFTGEDGWEASRAPDRITVTTSALDLRLPEQRKKVRGVTLRGIFPRDIGEEGVTFTLLGSLHRDRWHAIASAQGAHMRLLRGVSYRWYKVEIHSPYPAVFDAITFDISA